jgi:membrane associated rhomboid family serine protease
MSYYNSGNRIQKDTPIIFNLIIINVLVYAAQKFIGDNVTDAIALYPVNSALFKPYQIITHMFAHSPGMLFHIIFNMLALWMFGSVLERFWGPKKFLIFYLVCGIGAALTHLGMQYLRAEDHSMITQEMINQYLSENPTVPKYALGGALGASGAVMGVMVAFAYIFPNTELYMMFIPLPVKAKYAVPVMVAIDLFGGFASISGDTIAHFAHLGGALTGFLLVLYWNRTNRKTFY